MTSRRTRDRLIKRLEEKGIKNSRVLDVMGSTPRHLFLDEALSHRAYEDTSLPIGQGQTLSQPYIVALMTELLFKSGKRLDSVLEIGTGSGYQTAILAQLVDRVYSIERIKPLVDLARQRLRQLKLYNVQIRYADGAAGWPEHGPYDAILAAAAPATVPQELLNQLAPDGCLVIPVGNDSQQYLELIRREGASDQFEQHRIAPVRFVPFLPGITR